MAGGCLYTMSVHYSGGLLRSISSVSLWYPIGRHPKWVYGPQTGPSIAPENWYVGGTLGSLQLQRVSIRDGYAKIKSSRSFDMA